MAKVYTLFLVFGKDHVKLGLTHINAFSKRCYPGYKSHILIIDNALENDVQATTGDQSITSGDNSCLDFSGWEKGVSFLENHFEMNGNDVLIFCNDSFYRSYSYKVINGFQPEEVTPDSLQDRVAGFADSYRMPVSVLGYKFDKWIRSNFFIMTYKNYKKLDGLVFPLPPEEIFDTNIKHFFSDTFNISDNYKGYLRKWLFGKDQGYDEYTGKWHNAVDVTPETFEYLKKKARAILSEQFLSVKIINQGLSILDIKRHVPPKYHI